MSRRRTFCLALLASILLAGLNPAPAHAANFFTKLSRGAVNTATGWLEVPTQIGKAKKDTQVLWLFTGFGEGLIYGMTRTLVGIWDVVTFAIPPYDSVLIEPETLITEKRPRETANRPPQGS